LQLKEVGDFEASRMYGIDAENQSLINHPETLGAEITEKTTLLQEKKEGDLFLSKLIKPNNDNSIRGRKCPVKFNGRFMAWLAATTKL